MATPRTIPRPATKAPPAPNTSAGLGQLLCPVCWATFARVGSKRYCTDTWRKTAWNRGHAATVQVAEPVVPPAVRRRDISIYVCTTCETRYYAEQWCHDCNQPRTRVGLGGLCPHCSEPVAITDLIDTLKTSPIR